MHELATLDNMPQVFKIKYKENNIVFNSAYISGVDYDEETFGNEEYNEE